MKSDRVVILFTDRLHRCSLLIRLNQINIMRLQPSYDWFNLLRSSRTIGSIYWDWVVRLVHSIETESYDWFNLYWDWVVRLVQSILRLSMIGSINWDWVVRLVHYIETELYDWFILLRLSRTIGSFYWDWVVRLVHSIETESYDGSFYWNWVVRLVHSIETELYDWFNLLRLSRTIGSFYWDWVVRLVHSIETVVRLVQSIETESYDWFILLRLSRTIGSFYWDWVVRLVHSIETELYDSQRLPTTSRRALQIIYTTRWSYWVIMRSVGVESYTKCVKGFSARHYAARSRGISIHVHYNHVPSTAMLQLTNVTADACAAGGRGKVLWIATIIFILKTSTPWSARNCVYLFHLFILTSVNIDKCKIQRRCGW
jgi:hypothetical protein